MGLIISRFRRKKTTTDVLENLETEIQSIEQDGQYKEQARKRVLNYMTTYSVAMCMLFALIYYYKYAGRSQHWLHSLFYASPLLILPLLIIFLRVTVSWYFNWSLNKNRTKLKKMREEKKKILEDVMNTETYKVAKEILDKYGGPEEQPKALKPSAPLFASPRTPVPQFRQRLAIQNSSTPISNNNSIVPVNAAVTVYKGPRLTSQHLPRPLPDLHRSALDKVVDFLTKDGPSHRMALICSGCYAHNGMAMAEEFEFVSYICAYCGHMNAARKQKPMAPPLTPIRALAPIPRRPIEGGDDSSPPASSGGSDSEGEGNDDATTETGEGEPIRSPSPVEEEPKSEQEKKED